MSYKNTIVDEKIVKAAKGEFLKYGFSKASLRNIASKAGITTGSLYTRYSSKDDLFEKLIVPKMEGICFNLESANKLYYEAREEKNVDKFIDAMTLEKDLYLDIMFKYHDECVLLMCKSDGSSLGKKIDKAIDMKINSTVSFFKDKTNKLFDYDSMVFVLQEQINFFREILKRDFDEIKARAVMDSVKLFVAAGWKKIFEELI